MLNSKSPQNESKPDEIMKAFEDEPAPPEERTGRVVIGPDAPAFYETPRPRKKALPPMTPEMYRIMSVFFSTGGNGAETARITGKPKATVNDWAEKYGWRVKLGLSEAESLAEVQSESREAHTCRVNIGLNILKGVHQHIQEHPEIAKDYLKRAKDLETVGNFIEDSKRVLVQMERKVAIDPEKDGEQAPAPEPVKNPIDIN